MNRDGILARLGRVVTGLAGTQPTQPAPVSPDQAQPADGSPNTPNTPTTPAKPRPWLTTGIALLVTAGVLAGLVPANSRETIEGLLTTGAEALAGAVVAGVALWRHYRG